MNRSFAERLKNSARSWSGGWIIATVSIAIYLTACKGNPSPVPSLPGNGNGTNLPLIRLDLDLTPVVLGPQDLSDLFQGATYSITQAISSPESRGEIVTYPTQILPHTTAFANGFSTRIEIFTNVDQAAKSYDIILTQQSGETLAINLPGADSQAFTRPARTPEGFDLNSTEYAVLFRVRNAVTTIILRTDMKVSPTRLGQLAELVINRLQP